MYEDESQLSGTDGILSKVNGSGVAIWHARFSNSWNDSVKGVACDSSNNVYVVGTKTSDVEVSTDDYSGSQTETNVDIVVRMFLSSGSAVYTVVYGDTGMDKGNAIVMDSSNSLLYLTGATSSSRAITKIHYSD